MSTKNERDMLGFCATSEFNFRVNKISIQPGLKGCIRESSKNDVALSYLEQSGGFPAKADDSKVPTEKSLN